MIVNCQPSGLSASSYLSQEGKLKKVRAAPCVCRLFWGVNIGEPVDRRNCGRQNLKLL